MAQTPKKTPKTAKKPATPKSKKPAVTEPKATETVAETPATTPSWTDRLRAWAHHAGRFIEHGPIPEVLLVATLAMARYLANSDFSYPSEIILNIVLLSIFAVAFTYMYRVVLKHWAGIHVAALLLSYASYSFSYSFPRLQHFAERLIPDSATPFTNNMLVFLFLALVFGVIGYGVNRALQSATLKGLPVLQIIVFLVCFLFISEAGKVGLRVWTIRADLSYKQPALDLKQDKSKVVSKPNVYYLLFDRYANATTLKNQYNYDNSSLMNFFSDQGFTNRDDAYANYPFTMMSVSSTLGMNYHAKIGAQFKDDAMSFQTGFPYRTILDNPPVAQALKANGYSYNQVSTWWDFTRKIPAATTEPTESYRLRMFGKNFWLSDLQRDIVNKSILAPLVRKGITVGHTPLIKYQLDRNPVQNFEAQMAAVKDIAAASKTQKQPQFTFAHVLSPHDPYIFDATGKTPTYDQNRTDNGVDEKTKYTNQLTYLNTRIKDLVGNIRKNDPNAVIVVQADEGPYPKQFRGTLTSKNYYDPINLPTANMRQKFGVLASYYLPGVSSADTSANIDSSVNTFRYVLSHYLGYDLPSLPDCQFTAGDKFVLYSYQLVTGELKGTSNPSACAQYKYAK